MTDTVTDLRAAGAVETAALVRSGKVSALEVCDAAIDRIEQLDTPVNAVVVRDFERARAAAKAIDKTHSSDDVRPLLGVAMTVKESNDVEGLPSTWGYDSFAGVNVERDAVVVERLRAAGAVILGKTNAPVALADWQSVNPVYGRTSNPFDLSRSPGGSSGGAAVALATGMVPLEIGSDIGGSIRIPADLCGVYGHKPTYGIAPLKGHGFPGTDGVDVPLAVVGPMARNVADLEATLDIIAGPVAPSGYRLDLPAPRHRRLGDYRVLVLDRHPVAGADVSVRGAIAGFAEGLEAEGADVSRGTDLLPDLEDAHHSYVKYLMSIVGRGAPGEASIDANEFMLLQDIQLHLQRRWQRVFEAFDIVLAPAFGVAAFPHTDEPDWAKRFLTLDNEQTPYGNQLAWAGLATYPGLPSTAVPLALTPDGLPTGVQVMGGLYEDRTTLAFSRLAEEAGLCRDPASPFPQT